MRGPRWRSLINVLLALLYPLRPRRVAGVPGLAVAVMAYWISRRDAAAFFPPVESARRRPEGLVAVGGGLDAELLLRAYREGIYPHCHLRPMKWWAPAQRMVLFPDELHVGKTLGRVLRQGTYTVSFDRAFRDVIAGCAEPRANQTPLTWISRDVMEAYCRLHDLGHAHSVEVWAADGRLAGGLYGVAVGGVFFAESQFAHERDTSKVALTALCRHWVALGGRLVDCKQPSPHLTTLGARLIPRATFTAILHAARELAVPPAPWDVDMAPDFFYPRPRGS